MPKSEHTRARSISFVMHMNAVPIVYPLHMTKQEIAMLIDAIDLVRSVLIIAVLLFQIRKRLVLFYRTLV